MDPYEFLAALPIHMDWASTAVRLLNVADEHDFGICHVCEEYVQRRNCSFCGQVACTYHSLCFQQSTPTSVAIICRTCFELQGRQLAPT
eukprot:3100669-Amphidinium_carterae.1